MRRNGNRCCQRVLEERAIQHTHKTLGHLGVEKCMQQIKQAYHLKNLGHKVRKFKACCDTCQRVKFPNRTITTEERSHLPRKPGSLCVTDLFGTLPTSRGGVKYVLRCCFEAHKTLPAKGSDYKAMSEQVNKPLFSACHKTRSDSLRQWHTFAFLETKSRIPHCPSEVHSNKASSVKPQ